MRRLLASLSPLLLLVSACGSGGDGGGGGGGGGPTPTPAQATTMYVRISGDDTNDGLAPERAFRTLQRAAKDISAGDVVYVGPGRYGAPPVTNPPPIAALDILNAAGSAAQPIQILADVTGDHTGDPAGEVVIDGKDVALSLRISKSSYVIVDGFVIQRGKGNNGAGVQVRNLSSQITLRNCIVTDNIDGIRVENSTDVTLFNNLIYENSSRGIRLSGAPHTRIINNTIVHNQDRGVSVGGANANGVGSIDCALQNNIIQDNSNVSIAVDDGPPSSLIDYDGNFNLVFYARLADQTKTYRPASVMGGDDINLDAQFIDPGFALDQQNSPAVDAGTASIDGNLLSELFKRSTASNGSSDKPPVDLGYHSR
ncbi:MAG: right-handed parallel beta-helix repeat-containing protein [bacterium]